MDNSTQERCYSVQDIPSFFLESVDPSQAVLELHLGDQRVRLTKEAFYSMVGSFAQMAIELLESEPLRKCGQIH